MTHHCDSVQDRAVDACRVERLTHWFVGAAVVTSLGYLLTHLLTGRACPLDLSFWLFPAALWVLPLSAWCYSRFLVWSIHRADGRPRSSGRHRASATTQEPAVGVEAAGPEGS